MAPSVNEAYLHKWLLSKEMNRNASSVKKDLQKIVEAKADYDAEHFLMECLFSETKVDINKKNRDVKGQEVLEQMQTAILDYFCLHQMRILCEKANRNNILGVFPDYAVWYEQLEPILKQSKRVQVQAYDLAYQVLTGKDETSFYKLSKLLDKNKADEGNQIRTEVLTLVVNFLIFKVNNHELVFAPKLLDMTSHILEEQAVLPTGEVNYQLFKIAIGASIIAQKHEEAQRFLEQMKQLAKKGSSKALEARVSFIEAQMAFFAKNYKQSEQLVTVFRNSDYYYTDAFFKTGCDKLSLKTDYMLKQRDDSVLTQNIDSLRRYIDKQKNLNATIKKKHIQFLKLFKKLVNNKQIDLEKEKQSLAPIDYYWFTQL
ncbi:MAG: hypothetical protein MRY78_01995 [Saprospiraceae bacterium]|nr:hypothetical protein [Saprospiraceae bacterium]